MLGYMQKEKTKEILQCRLNEANKLMSVSRNSPEFDKWKRDTRVAIAKIFHDEKHISDFTTITYCFSTYIGLHTEADYQNRYIEGLMQAIAILNSFIDEIDAYGIYESTEICIESVSLVEKLCKRFHHVARQLSFRHAKRNTLIIDDEYDVQDLMHSILVIEFDDIRPEEYTPSYAGSNSRMDFLLKQEQIVIETKKTRNSLRGKELGDELIIDIEKYANHQDCKTLICFVYDPEELIKNPRGLENDLSGQHGDLNVKVIITP